MLSAPDDKVGNESCQVRRGRFASQRTLRRGTHGTRPLTRGRLAVPSRGCGAFPSVWCELTCGRPGAEPASPAGRRAPPCGPGARAWSGSGLVARRSSRGGWERWLRAAAAARPPAPAVGRRKRGTPPPHRIITCTQGRVTSPASPPQSAASRRSAAAPEASAALRAPQSRGHCLSDTSGPGESAASAAGAAVVPSAPHSSPSHRLAGILSRPRGHLFRPSSEARGTDGRPRRPRAKLRAVAR